MSGAVTLDGQPLPAGTISFIPKKGIGAAGPIEDGKYSVANVPSGSTTVTVETASIQKRIEDFTPAASQAPQRSSGGQMTPEMLAQMPENARKQVQESQKQAAEAASKMKELKAKFRPIPEKYSKAESSGLTVEVKSGANTFDVSLSSK